MKKLGVDFSKYSFPKMLLSIDFFVFLFLCNFLLSLAWLLNDLPAVAGTNWMSKSKEILSLNIPSDNYYPPGSAILSIPFRNFTDVSLMSTFFWANVGFIFFFLITYEIKNFYWIRVTLITFLSNVYLFWNLKSSQDTVYEFAFVMISVYALIKRKFLLAVMSLFLLFQVRSGYWLLFILVVFIFLFKRKSLYLKKNIFILSFGLLIFSSLFNFVSYGTLSPSNTSGQTLYFGQNKYFYLGHPSYDIDTFLSEGGHMTPKGFSSKELWNRDLTELDNIFKQQALDDIRNNPESFIQNTLIKLDNLFFNFQKIPNLPGTYWLSEDGKKVYIEGEGLNLKYALGNLVYFLYRFISIMLLIYSVSLWLYFRKSFKTGDLYFSLWNFLPILSILPVCIIFYEDTRFRIVAESLLIPASAYLLIKINKLRIA
jgi:hypothetical protein